MKRFISFVLVLLFVGVSMGQTARPGRTPRWDRLVSWILNGQETLTYKTLTSPTITGAGLSGTTTFSGPINVGEDGTGYDVKLFGATASNYVLWDESEDLFSVVQTNANTSGTEQAMTVTLTQTGAGVISEAFYAKVIANVQTGSWVNAIVGRVDYSTGSTGDAGGGMAAAICAELNLPAKTPSGGTYTCMDLELEAPANYTAITNSTTFPVSYIRMGLWGNGTATDSWQDYGYIFHLADLDDATGNVFFDNTLRILVNTTAWYLPMSSAQASYTSAYPVVTTRVDPDAAYNGIYTTVTQANTYSGSIAGVRSTLTMSSTAGIGNMYAGRFELIQSGLPSSQGHTTALYAQTTTTTSLNNPTSVLTLCLAGVSGGNLTPFINILDASTTKTVTLMEIGTGDNVGTGTSGTALYETSANIDNVNEITAGLRVKVNGVDYYLLMATPTDIQD